MTDRDPVPEELVGLFAAERAAPAGDAEMRAKIRTRLAGVVGLLPAKAAAAGTATVLGGSGKIIAIVAISVGAGITATAVATSSEPSYAAAPAIHLVPDVEAPPPTPQHVVSDEARTPVPAPDTPVVATTAPITAKTTVRATTTAAATPATPAPALSEVKLLKRAWSALSSGDAGQALRVTREAERLYPDGALVEEREALRIQSLATLGLRTDARTAARQFIAKFPGSVHRTRVENAVNVEGSP